MKCSFRHVLSYSAAALTSSSSEWVLCVCRGWERFRNGRLTTRYPTTVARSAKEHTHRTTRHVVGVNVMKMASFQLQAVTGARGGLDEEQILTLSNYTVHDAHGEAEEDEVMQVVHLEEQSGLHSHIHSGYRNFSCVTGFIF